jgi:hypothetical protein
MPRREYRLKLEARRAAEAAAASAEALDAKDKARANAEKARKTYTRRKVVPATPNEHTLPGRIDLSLAKINRTRIDMERDAGITVHTMQALTRGVRKTLRPKTLETAAQYLGVEVAWLRDGTGKGAGEPAAAIVPAAPAPTPAARQNGSARLNGNASHQGKVDAAMRANLQSTMSSLWGLMPMDVQVMIVSKMAELLAQQAQHQ